MSAARSAQPNATMPRPVGGAVWVLGLEIC